MGARRIAVTTGTRADYGLLYPLLCEIRNDPAFELQLIVTGMHLSPEFGLTYRDIEKDGMQIGARVEMLLSGDTPSAIAKSIGLGTIGFADVLQQLRPDLLVLLGDRFEALAAAQAALVARIPIAHIHGGEVTEGAIDEAVRHSITKMASLHFVAGSSFRRRVIQLGEQPDRVFNFGAPGLDNIRRLKLLERDELERVLGFSLGARFFLVTYHPATLGSRPPEESMGALLHALDAFPDARVVMTYPNADTGGRILIRQVERYAATNPGRVLAVASLGQLRYLSVMRQADVVVGNSSSGLIEAPTFRKPTVNIGERQRGRPRAVSVIDCDEAASAIVRAITKATSTEFQSELHGVVNPYGDGKAATRIADELRRVALAGLANKRFNDVAYSAPDNQAMQ